jgi:hypothetical protein
MSAAESSLIRDTPLPPSLQPLFWDCDFAQLDWQQHRDFIVRRVLAEGSWEAICWLRARVGDPGLREWIERHEGRSLSPQQLRFWELVLDLPTEAVNTWLRSAERTIWEGRIRR